MKEILVILGLFSAFKLEIENDRNVLYTIKASFGTPEQDLQLSVSTFSPVSGIQYTWVLDDKCYPCHEALNPFVPEESSTFVVKDWRLLSFEVRKK